MSKSRLSKLAIARRPGRRCCRRHFFFSFFFFLWALVPVARPKPKVEMKLPIAKVERGARGGRVVASGPAQCVTTVQGGSRFPAGKEIFADCNTSVRRPGDRAHRHRHYELRRKPGERPTDAAQSAVSVALAGIAAQQAELRRVKITWSTPSANSRARTDGGKKFISPAEVDQGRARCSTATREQLKARRRQIEVSEAQ